LGASKPLRMADWVVRDLPLQESIPGRVVKGIASTMELKGAGCIVYGEHLCMRMRGVESPCSDMVTPLLTGVMREEPYISTFYHCSGMQKPS
jgi:GTP cyclohydrolase I